MAGAPEIAVSVVYAMPGQQEVVELMVPKGTTLDEAVALSGIQSKFPETNIESLQKGVWYEKKAGDAILNDGDRIEIYRPLITDAKEARRLRAEKRRKRHT